MWFYSKDGKSKDGPVSSAELQALAQTGQLLPTDMVWKEGMRKWVPAENIKGLFTVPAAAATLPPATVPSPSVVLAVAKAEGHGAPSPPRLYFMQKGQQFGPFPLNQMQQWVASGQLRPDDLVWVEGTPAWVTAREVDLLFPKVAKTPAAPVEAIPMVLPVEPIPKASITDSANYRRRYYKEDVPLVYDAIYAGNLSVVQSMLDTNPDLIHLNYDGLGTLLHEAARHARKSVVQVAIARLFLARGAKVNARDKLGNTPLHVLVLYSAKDNESETRSFAEFLFAHGADVNAAGHNGNTPLHDAAHTFAHVVRLLLSHSADARAQAEKGWTPLHDACTGPLPAQDLEERKRIICLLLEAGADINAQLDDYETPLWCAFSRAHQAEEAGDKEALGAAKELIAFLRERGAHVIDKRTKKPAADEDLAWLAEHLRVVQKEAPDDEPQRVVTPRFSFDAPPGWQVEWKSESDPLVVGPRTDEFAPNINVVEESFNGSLKAYVNASLDSYPQAFPKFRLLEQEAFTTQEGMQGKRLVFENEQDGWSLRQIQYFFANGHSKFVVTFTALAEDGQRFDPTIDASMETFRFERDDFGQSEEARSAAQPPARTTAIILSDFSVGRHFRLIQWGATLQYNLMRAAFAGLVVGIIMLFIPDRPLPIAACFTAPLWWPFAYLIYLLPILFIRMVARVSLQSSPDSQSGLAMFGCLMAWVFIIFALFLVAVGDPLVCLVKAIFPRAVPVETPPLFSLQPIIFVLDASEVTIAS